MTGNEMLDARFDRIQKRAFILGIAALIISVLDGIRAPEQFFRSYLLGYVFWLGFPLGCAAFLMVHHLTGGFWGLPIRRPLEAATRTLPLLNALALPLLLGLARWHVLRATSASTPLRQKGHSSSGWH